MKLTALLLGLATFASLANAESSPRDPKPVRTDCEVVRSADYFSIGGTGIAGTISASETSLRKILQTPSAAEDCRKLAATGTPAGQLYGLLGLKLLKDSTYHAAAARQKDSQVEVQVTSGCMITKRPASAVARLIDEGKIK